MDAKKKTWGQIVANKVKFVSNYLNWQQTTLTLTSWIRLTITMSEQVVVNMITNRESRSEGFILSTWLSFLLCFGLLHLLRRISGSLAAGCFTSSPVCSSRSVCRYTVVSPEPDRKRAKRDWKNREVQRRQRISVVSPTLYLKTWRTFHLNLLV